MTLCFVSCKKTGFETNASGYQCPKCKFKFYTDSSVFPEFCPSCKADGVSGAIGYICSKDQHVTIPPPDKAPTCEQCGAALTSVKILDEADLKTWGAVKKARAEVYH